MSAQNGPLICAERLCKDYPMGQGVLHVLRSVDLEVARGEIVSIVGPSGAGKSTLLHLLGALDRPTSGSVRYEGEDLALLSPAEQAARRNQAFGFVFQFYHLLPDFNALENVYIPAMIRCEAWQWPARRRALQERAADLLGQLGLGDRGRHRPSQLSGGERQRVAIARALMNDPQVLFCDEPTGNLDTDTGRRIQDLLWSLNRGRGCTLVVATHDERVAGQADRIVRMVDGRIVASDRQESR